MLERDYQPILIKKLRALFPDCVIMKNDTDYMQGFPDLTILYKDMWAVLEVKASRRSPEQANQGYYIEMLSQLSYAAFVYPENEEEVLRELQQAFNKRSR